MTGQGPDDVARTITATLVSGRLPAHNPVSLATQRGTGTPCSACERPIGPDETECVCDVPFYELLHLHLACFTEWRRQLT